MAIMHPADIENYNPVPSERRFYEALKTQLPDKYEVFYSVRWFDTSEEKERIDSESDFLIFDPSFGFLTIEAKGGFRIDVEGDKWYLHERYPNGETGIRKLKCSPYIQAEKSMRHFYKHFDDEFRQEFKGVYGFAVAFPQFRLERQLAPEGSLDLTIDLGDMKDLHRKINRIFHYWRNNRNITIPFSVDQRRRFISLINKQVAMSAAAGALIPVKEKEFSRINVIQDSILDCLCNYRQVRIVGGAGTGKTFIGIKKASRDALEGKKVLFVCCNPELAKFVSGKLERFSQVDCRTYEELMHSLLGEAYLRAPVNQNGNRDCFELLDGISQADKYDSIIVDEAQDFDLDMGLSIRCLLRSEENSELYVFYDENQNVFHQSSENVFAIAAPPYVLRYNIRNTARIYDCAVERTGLGRDTVASSVEGAEPDLRTCKSRSLALNNLETIVNRLVRKENVSTKSIVIVSDVAFEHSILADEARVGAYELDFGPYHSVPEGKLCFKTADAFKGLEADVVLYLKHDFEDLALSERMKKREYVAITRARYYLYIISTKCKASE